MKRTSLLAIAALVLLVESAMAGPATGTELRVVFVRDGVFTNPTDSAWNGIPEVTVPMQAQIVAPPIGGGSVSRISVRATHDGEEIAFRLQWSDATADRGVGVNTFRDAAAVGFPVGRTTTAPSPFMGDAEHPVVIWQWAADFEADAEGKSRFGDRYPHSEGVWIFPQDLSVRRSVRGWRGAEPVIEYLAAGWGTLTRRVTTSLKGNSVYRRGQWSVVIHRTLESPHEMDPVFIPGEPSSLIFAVWNGEKEEVNGRKAASYAWTPAILDGIGVPTARSDLGVSGGD